MDDCGEIKIMAKVSDDQVKEFIEFYGEDKIPNPEQYPIRFKFLLETFKYVKSRQPKSTDLVVKEE